MSGPFFSLQLTDPERFRRAAYCPLLRPYADACGTATASAYLNTRAMPRVNGKPRRSLPELPRAYPMVRAAVEHLSGVLLDHRLILALYTDVSNPEDPWP